MKPRTVAVLAVLGVVAFVGGWYYGVATVPSEQQSVNAGKLMFPGLTKRLPQVAKIEIIHQGKPLTIERHGDAWGLVNRDLYPVQETKLRGMLTALTELRLVAPRTSDPAQYAVLGVEDPTSKDTGGTADLLRLVDAAGKPLASLIVGHRRVRSQANVPDQVYVRRPHAKQSWLAEGDLQVDADPQLWLDRDIMNLDHARIAKVVSTRGASTVDLVRKGDRLVLQTPAQHPKLDDYKLEDVSRALELLTFEDVHKTSGKDGELVGHAVFTTTDGMAITVTVYHPPPPTTIKSNADQNILVQFAVTGHGKAKAEADHLEHKVAGWTYQLGSWKEKSLLPTVDTLEAPASSHPATAATTGSAAPAKP